jgi:hypothetical protein
MDGTVLLQAPSTPHFIPSSPLDLRIEVGLVWRFGALFLSSAHGLDLDRSAGASGDPAVLCPVFLSTLGEEGGRTDVRRRCPWDRRRAWWGWVGGRAGRKEEKRRMAERSPRSREGGFVGGTRREICVS